MIVLNENLKGRRSFIPKGCGNINIVVYKITVFLVYRAV